MQNVSVSNKPKKPKKQKKNNKNRVARRKSNRGWNWSGNVAENFLKESEVKFKQPLFAKYRSVHILRNKTEQIIKRNVGIREKPKNRAFEGSFFGNIILKGAYYPDLVKNSRDCFKNDIKKDNTYYRTCSCIIFLSLLLYRFFVFSLSGWKSGNFWENIFSKLCPLSPICRNSYLQKTKFRVLPTMVGTYPFERNSDLKAKWLTSSGICSN